MEGHLLHDTEGNEIIESKEIFNIPEIKEEEIEIHTEIYEKSDESLCSNENDNSIPFCNILLSKFLDLTPENDSPILKDRLSTSTAAKKSENNSATQSLSPERKDEQNDLRNANKETNLLNSYTERQDIVENDLQDANEEVYIEAEITKHKKYAERYERYRERKKRLENDELYLANKRKQYVEALKRYRLKKKMKKYGLQETAAKKSENNSAAQSLSPGEKDKKNLKSNANKETDLLDSSREKEAIQENNFQDSNEEVDIQAEIDKIEKRAERQRLYRERKKLENDELYLASQRKSMTEASRRFREREKMKKANTEDEIDGDTQAGERLTKKYKLRKKLGNDEYVSYERKRQAEASKRYRERQKMKKVDIEVEIERRKKNAEKNRLFRARKRMEINAERMKRYYGERKETDDYELYLANKSKKNAEKPVRRSERQKMKKYDLRDGNEEVDIEVAIINPEINIEERNQ